VERVRVWAVVRRNGGVRGCVSVFKPMKNVCSFRRTRYWDSYFLKVCMWAVMLRPYTTLHTYLLINTNAPSSTSLNIGFTRCLSIVYVDELSNARESWVLHQISRRAPQTKSTALGKLASPWTSKKCLGLWDPAYPLPHHGIILAQIGATQNVIAIK